MKRRVGLPLALFGALALTACATFGDLEKGLDSLVGKDVGVASGILGDPSDKRQVGEETVYTWVRHRIGMLMIPETTPTGSGSTMYYMYIPVSYHCTIKLFADASGKVNKWQYDGNLGGCGPYIRLLKDYAKKNEQKARQKSHQE